MNTSHAESLLAQLTAQGKELSLDIGCGNRKRASLGMDYMPGDQVDIVGDVNEGIPFPDSSVSRIVMHHSLEHVLDPVRVLSECRRILKAKGVLDIRVPHHSNPTAFQVHHKTYWNLFSFDPVITERGKSNEQDTWFTQRSLGLKMYVGQLNFLSSWAVRHRYAYELYLWHVLPAYEVQVVLEKP